MVSVDTQPGPLETSVRAALTALDASQVDAATAELAATYARQVDDGADLERLGPLLLAALDALLMTPKARAAAVKGGARGHEHRSPLDELRARRARRNSATAVDTAAP